MSLRELLKLKKKIEKKAEKIKKDAEKYKEQIREFKDLFDELIAEELISAKQVTELGAFYERARMHRRPLDF